MKCTCLAVGQYFVAIKYNLKTRSMEKQKHSVLYEKDKHKSDALSHLFICLKCFIIKRVHQK